MVRPGMVGLIAELRRRTDTSENQTVINGVSYWSDDQLQTVLDQHGDFYETRLSPRPVVQNGVLVYKRFLIPELVPAFIEADTHSVVNERGEPVSDYEIVTRQVLFTVSQPSPALYIRCVAFDMVGATAQIWLEKAGHRAALINWKAGTQTLNEDQEYKHCIEQYNLWAKSRVYTRTLTRSGYYGQ